MKNLKNLVALHFFIFLKKELIRAQMQLRAQQNKCPPPPQKLLPGYLINNGYLSYTCVWIFTYSNFPKALQKFF